MSLKKQYEKVKTEGTSTVRFSSVCACLLSAHET